MRELPDQVEVDLDDAGPPPSAVSGWSRPLVALAVVIVVGTLVAGLVVRSGGGDGDDEDVADVTTTGPDVTTVEVPTVAELLAQMPAGPLDGKASWKLPVLAQPQSEVVDGQVVTVLGRGFVPSEQVGIVMCTSEAGVQGVAACDLGVDGEKAWPSKEQITQWMRYLKDVDRLRHAPAGQSLCRHPGPEGRGKAGSGVVRRAVPESRARCGFAPPRRRLLPRRPQPVWSSRRERRRSRTRPAAWSRAAGPGGGSG